MRELLTQNLILSLSVIAWAFAQGLKLVITLVQRKQLDWRLLFSSGGMPSSHSSFVCACATSTGFVCGWSSPLFALAAGFSFIVMYDAANVRHAAGEQAKVLNYIMDHWNGEYRPALFMKDLKELLGHTPLQVFFGALLGILVGGFGYWYLG